MVMRNYLILTRAGRQASTLFQVTDETGSFSLFGELSACRLTEANDSDAVFLGTWCTI